MNADELTKDLREWARSSMASDSRLVERLNEAADLIASLQDQLAASQRRADAAVEDIYKMKDGGECDICKHYNPDKNTCAKPFVPYDDCFEWRGPQDAGERRPR